MTTLASSCRVRRISRRAPHHDPLPTDSVSVRPAGKPRSSAERRPARGFSPPRASDVCQFTPHQQNPEPPRSRQPAAEGRAGPPANRVGWRINVRCAQLATMRSCVRAKRLPGQQSRAGCPQGRKPVIRQSAEAPCRSADARHPAPGAPQLLRTVSLTAGAGGGLRGRPRSPPPASPPTGTAPTAIERRFTPWQRCQTPCRKARC